MLPACETCMCVERVLVFTYSGTDVVYACICICTNVRYHRRGSFSACRIIDVWSFWHEVFYACLQCIRFVYLPRVDICACAYVHTTHVHRANPDSSAYRHGLLIYELHTLGLAINFAWSQKRRRAWFKVCGCVCLPVSPWISIDVCMIFKKKRHTVCMPRLSVCSLDLYAYFDMRRSSWYKAVRTYLYTYLYTYSGKILLCAHSCASMCIHSCVHFMCIHSCVHFMCIQFHVHTFHVHTFHVHTLHVHTFRVHTFHVTYIHVHTFHVAYIHVHTFHAHTSHANTSMRIRPCACIHVHTFMYIHSCAYISHIMCIHFMCIHSYAYISCAYIPCAYIHVHTFMYIHSCAYISYISCAYIHVHTFHVHTCAYIPCASMYIHPCDPCAHVCMYDAEKWIRTHTYTSSCALF